MKKSLCIFLSMLLMLPLFIGCESETNEPSKSSDAANTTTESLNSDDNCDNCGDINWSPVGNYGPKVLVFNIDDDPYCEIFRLDIDDDGNDDELVDRDEDGKYEKSDTLTNIDIDGDSRSYGSLDFNNDGYYEVLRIDTDGDGNDNELVDIDNDGCYEDSPPPMEIDLHNGTCRFEVTEPDTESGWVSNDDRKLRVDIDGDGNYDNLGYQIYTDIDDDGLNERFIDFDGDGCYEERRIEVNIVKKPVIYLYPEEETDVEVKLDYNGDLTFTYPAYGDGWNVTAYPDGRLIDKATGKEYFYLFWEGISDIEYDMSRGFVVKGEDTAAFLQETLAKIGLTPREYNDFIVFWLPMMQENPYNLITFQTDVYTENAKLEISPEPDSLLRVFMAYQALEEPIEIEAPVLEPFVREGFTVVEWGGTEVQ